MQKDRHENHAPEPRGNQQPRRNRHAVKKSVDHQPQQRRIARMRVRNFFVMRLLSKMKMRRDRMLEKVHQKISGKHEKENRIRELLTSAPAR